MKAIQILTVIIISTNCQKQPILTLQLDLTPTKDLQTTFGIGNSQVRVDVDINYNQLDICCKNKDTLLKNIYYFMMNPFNQREDYHCKNIKTNSKQNDTAEFQSIGPVAIAFNQIIYPKCTVGRMGFNKKSYFLSLMPKISRFCIFQQERNRPQSKGFHWKIMIGGSILNQFTYFQTLKGDDWRVAVDKITFNDIPFHNQTVKLISDKYLLSIPTLIYSLIRHDLINNFQCSAKDHKIYCPCIAGISSSFPKFNFLFKQGVSFSILQTKYLNENDEVCSTIIAQSSTNNWQVNILLLDNADILFDYDLERVGLAHRRSSIQTNDLINNPLQIMLNSVVILIMCFFVAMVIIQLIKYFTGIEEASNESFQTYMLKHAE